MKTKTTSSIKKSFKLRDLLIFSCLLSIHVSALCQSTDSTGTTLFVTKTLHSKILGENRRIHIYSPAKPNDNTLYPVLYMTDGEAMMTMVTGQVQYLSESYKIIPSMIIVGIENTDRTRDLTPTHSITGPDGKPDTSANAFGKNSGGGEKFLQFMQQELMPYISNNYPTAAYRVFLGHSLGGLMAVHAMVNHPGLFNSYIAISPSLQWDDNALLKQLERLKDNDALKGSLFFSDANESSSFHQNQLRFDSLLKQKDPKGLHFKYNSYPDETHISEPVKAFYDGIRNIYPDWYLPYNSSAFRKTMTAKMVKDQYDMLSKKYGYHVIPPQYEMNQVSKMLRRDPKKINDAIELLEMNTKNYPASSLTYEILGDTYLQMGDTKNALASFEKVISLDKENETVKQKIKKLSN